MLGYICRKLANTWGWASHPHHVFIPSTITFPWPNLSEISFIPTKVAIHHGNWRDPQIFCWPVGGIDVTCHPEYNFDTNPRKLRNFQTMQKKSKKYQKTSLTWNCLLIFLAFSRGHLGFPLWEFHDQSLPSFGGLGSTPNDPWCSGLRFRCKDQRMDATNCIILRT